jgi:fructose/tagatose bisphosphate aldolase
MATPAGKERVAEGRAVIVHSLDHARAALAAASALRLPVTLLSPPLAAAYMGAGYFRALIEAAGAEFPDVAVTAVLDCGDEPGFALAALREGIKAVRFTGPDPAAQRLRQIAEKQGAVLILDEIAALDLLDRTDAEAACRAWFSATE